MGRSKKGKRKRKDIITWSKILTLDEQQTLIRHLKSQADTVMGKIFLLVCDILLNTGLRISELCALQVMHTPFVLGVNFIEVYRGKNDKDRSVPVSSRLSAAITKYIRHVRPRNLPKHVHKTETDRPLFYNSLQAQFTRNALYKRIRRAAAKAGITKRITPHMFRHTYATNVLMKGEDIYRLQGLLGHSDLMTTMKYLHFVQDMDAAIGDRIDQSFEDTFWG